MDLLLISTSSNLPTSLALGEYEIVGIDIEGSMDSTMVKERQRPWQEIAKEAQRYRDATIAEIEPPVPEGPIESPRDTFDTIRSYLTSDEVAITELLPQQLLERLRTGKVAATAVTNAFLRRAALVQKLVGDEQSLWFSQFLSRVVAE